MPGRTGARVAAMPSSLALAFAPAVTIDDVLERMATIDTVLPAHDGVAYFNRLYRRVTEHVSSAIDRSSFEDAEFLERLDVVFANLYFEAVLADQRGADVADAWEPLFACRWHAGSVPIQFALAGMNAHINHDLPLAIVATCRDFALTPDDDSPQHHDFTATNTVLEQTQETIKGWFTAGLIADVDEACGKLDDALAMWSIAGAREVAWNNAQTVWALEGNPGLLELYLRTLARMVNFAGRGLLI
jgi:hypothetical protein